MPVQCLRIDVYPFSNLTCSTPCHGTAVMSLGLRRKSGAIADSVSTLKRSGSCEHDEHGLRRLRDIEPENRAISGNKWQQGIISS